MLPRATLGRETGTWPFRYQAFWSGRGMRTFYALQIGDVLTTLLFMSRGIAETNPLADYLMHHFGTLIGLIVLKGAAISVALLCNVASHPKFMHRINAVYVVIVLLNILTLCTVKPA
jgi:hypothetical protein